ncbi:hypothetical protein EUGRSUZ_C01419 [Eucalyptus grandis]|uniref:Uncharacterized protein n=2 Tax=Eucalyptus grandis TaxID=71139 RepID=A0ACC3LCM3_EUCGR|nr:hypothetical protein EUGRSUZ_C01419 [Eucalyptus grandis]
MAPIFHHLRSPFDNLFVASPASTASSTPRLISFVPLCSAAESLEMFQFARSFSTCSGFHHRHVLELLSVIRAANGGLNPLRKPGERRRLKSRWHMH